MAAPPDLSRPSTLESLMTPRHPPRALTDLTTPIGAPPPGKEGGVDAAGRVRGPGRRPRRLATRRPAPGAALGSLWISKGSCSCSCLVPADPRAAGDVKLCVEYATRPPSVPPPSPGGEPGSGRAWLGPSSASPRGEALKGPSILVPTTELPKSAGLPAGGRRRPNGERRRPPPGGAEGSRRGRTAKTSREARGGGRRGRPEGGTTPDVVRIAFNRPGGDWRWVDPGHS